MPRYRKVHYYKGCRDPLALVSAVCPDWRMVEVESGGHAGAFYGVRYAGGSFTWHTGPQPHRCGIYCDAQWRPVVITTAGGRALPRLDAPPEEAEAAG